MRGNEERALSLLGLAMRAGQVISGDDMSEREIRAGRAAFALLDGGVSGRTREKYQALCQGRGIPLYETGVDALGKSIGRDNRMIAVVRKGPLAKQMETLLFCGDTIINAGVQGPNVQSEGTGSNKGTGAGRE